MPVIDNAVIEQLNRKAQQYNSERQRLLGAKEAATQEYERRVMAYKQKYGVDITPETLQQEYNTVLQQATTEYEALNEQIRQIESGEYKTNQATPSFNPTPELPKQEVVQPQVVQQFDAPVVQQTGVPFVPSQSPNPVAQQFTVSADKVAEATSFNPTAVAEESPQETETYTPPNWGTPARDIDSEFSNIFGANK